MRNFWIVTKVDGRQTVDATGPRARDGGFETDVYANVNGESVRVAHIEGFATLGTGNSLAIRIIRYGDDWEVSQYRPTYSPSENVETRVIQRG